MIFQTQQVSKLAMAKGRDHWAIVVHANGLPEGSQSTWPFGASICIPKNIFTSYLLRFLKTFVWNDTFQCRQRFFARLPFQLKDDEIEKEINRYQKISKANSANHSQVQILPNSQVKKQKQHLYFQGSVCPSSEANDLVPVPHATSRTLGFSQVSKVMV